MKEIFAIPAVGAIIIKYVDDAEFILVSNRRKNDTYKMNGLLEILAGRIREYFCYIET